MFAGHFGVAAVIKSKTPELPLWSLLVSTQLLDIAFIPFSLAGIETMEPIGEGGYGRMLIYAFYTHSLVGALLLSILAACLAGGLWGKKSGIIIGLVAFSHWILDLFVHRPDMPILPGNIGNFPLLGFGLWESVSVSILIEFLLIAAGSFFYFRYAIQTSSPKLKGKGVAAGCAMILFLFLSLVMDAFL
ncbi:permease [Neobacillus niacini]|uniref:permease n=1 Tax=Neobacillus niacini TaxID=86668 RepID=UPI002FFF99E4